MSVTRKMFDERRGIKRYEFLCCLIDSKAEQDIVLEALECEGYIWCGTRDNPTKHHYSTPHYIAAMNNGTIGMGTNGGTPISVDEFLKNLRFIERRRDDD